MSRRSLFSDEEDAIILSYIMQAEEEKTSLKPYFMVIADRLGRTVSSVTNRATILKKQMRATSGLSEGEKLIIKLKAISKEKERSAERIDLYKNKFNALKGEHDELKKKYEALLAEHVNLVNTVKLIVGDDSDTETKELEES